MSNTFLDPVTGLATERVQLTGSNAYEEYDVIARILQGSQGVQTVSFGSTTNNISIANDGTTDVRCALNGTVAPEVDNTASQLTYVGTWSPGQVNASAYGGSYTQANATNDASIINPGVSVLSIGWATFLTTVCGIQNFKVSTDGGTTWVDPSTISGIIREDGATGTNMNTYDAYAAATQVSSIAFRFPYAANWQLKILASGTKNATSTGTYIVTDAAWWELPKIPLTIKAGETFKRRMRVSNISYRAVTGSPSLRIVGDW